MSSKSSSVSFFDAQFTQQVHAGDFELNPFERLALPYVQGKVLDFGCGLGNLAVAAARQGAHVMAMDASATAIAYLQQRARQDALNLEAVEADLSDYQLSEDFDTVVCIGLLMFLDCASALRQLAQLKQRLRPGGVLILNTLVTGTTYLDMFDAQNHCLLSSEVWQSHFKDWQIEHCAHQEFPAPDQRIKSFVTLIARKPDR